MIPPPDRAPSAPRAPHGAPRGPGKHRSPESTERSASNPEAVVPALGRGYGQPQRGWQRFFENRVALEFECERV